MVSALFVEHAALGFAFAILSLFALAITVIAIVLATITNSCWWSCDVDGDPLLGEYDDYLAELDSEPIETVIGHTPKHAEIV